MAKEVKGYKVVRARGHDGVLLSAAVHDLEWVVAYVPGIPAYGRGKSALFGFDSLPHAKNYARYFPRTTQVWEARLGRPRLRKRIAPWVDRYLAFWSGKGKRRNSFRAPVGTMTCESITLLKQVA